MKHLQVKCFWCSKEFNQRIDTFKRQQANYGHNCCKNCFGKEPTFRAARKRVMLTNNHLTGKKLSPEHITQMRLSRLGIIPWNLGLKFTSNREVKNSGEWMKFRKIILIRDGEKCLKCGSDKKLHIHHIISQTKFPEFIFKETNCLTLCQMCHNEFHSKYGKSNFNIKDIFNFINETENSYSQYCFD